MKSLAQLLAVLEKSRCTCNMYRQELDMYFAIKCCVCHLSNSTDIILGEDEDMWEK